MLLTRSSISKRIKLQAKKLILLMIIQKSDTIPQARFGHTVTPIAPNKILVFAGAIGTTDSYDFTNQLFTWKKVETGINKPAPRAAHATICVEAYRVLMYGGATARKMASDQLHHLSVTEENKGEWSVLQTVGANPGKRYGHTMTYNKPFVALFGGNRVKVSDLKDVQQAGNDTWLLNYQSKPLTWVYLNVTQAPSPRIYHSACLCPAGYARGMIVIFGGRSQSQQALNDIWGLRRHTDGRWDWTKAPSSQQISAPIARYQHTSIFIGSLMVVIGGRSNPNVEQITLQVYDTDTSIWRKFKCHQRFRHGSWANGGMIYNYGGFDQSLSVPTDSIQTINLQNYFKTDSHLLSKLKSTQTSAPSSPTSSSSTSASTAPQTPTLHQQRKSSSLMQGKLSQIYQPQKKFKVMSEQVTQSNVISLANYFLTELCNQKNLKSRSLKQSHRFNLDVGRIVQLCEQVELIIKAQPMVLRVRAPLKIYGDVHGQFTDLMEFFKIYGSPVYGNQDGDIQGFDYIFLGDFVDRGNHSLQVLCLLFALKLKYPKQVHLIRGNHQDRGVNNAFGFMTQCQQRLGQNSNDPNSVFAIFNQVFDWLPLAAIVQDKIICLHGGIGSTLKTISDIENIRRPLQVIHTVSSKEEQLIVDILWSDPTQSDAELGIRPNTVRDPDGTGHIVKFGPDVVHQFLKKNGLSHIIRAHQCVSEGFQRFAGGALITVFSATDYCGKHKNAGAMLILKKNLQIQPKLIRPSQLNQENWLDDEQINKRRPPTPPRWKSSVSGRK